MICLFIHFLCFFSLFFYSDNFCGGNFIFVTPKVMLYSGLIVYCFLSNNDKKFLPEMLKTKGLDHMTYFFI